MNALPIQLTPANVPGNVAISPTAPIVVGRRGNRGWAGAPWGAPSASGRRGKLRRRYSDAFHSVGSEVKLNVSSNVRVYSPGSAFDLKQMVPALLPPGARSTES